MNSNTEDVLFLTPEDDNNQLITNLDFSTDKSKLSDENLDDSQSQAKLNTSGRLNDELGDLNEPGLNHQQQILKDANLNSNSAQTNQNVCKLDANLLTDMKYLFKNTRYFLIKSNNYENVHLAKTRVIRNFFIVVLYFQ